MACAADTTDNTLFSGVTVKELDTIVAKRRSLGQLKSYLERTIDEVQSCCLMAESNAIDNMIHTLKTYENELDISYAKWKIRLNQLIDEDIEDEMPKQAYFDK